MGQARVKPTHNTLEDTDQPWYGLTRDIDPDVGGLKVFLHRPYTQDTLVKIETYVKTADIIAQPAITVHQTPSFGDMVLVPESKEQVDQPPSENGQPMYSLNTDSSSRPRGHTRVTLCKSTPRASANLAAI